MNWRRLLGGRIGRRTVFLAGAIFLGAVVSADEMMIEKGFELQRKAPVIPKDPMIAGLLSVQCPGLGQIYCRQYLRGTAYLVSEIGCFVTAAALAGVEVRGYSWAAINEESSEERTLATREMVSEWDDLSGLSRAGVVGFALTGVALHVWNALDAYHLAQDHNQQMLCWIRDIDVQLRFEEKELLVKVALSKKF
jgi:hypothetical protein